APRHSVRPDRRAARDPAHRPRVRAGGDRAPRRAVGRGRVLRADAAAQVRGARVSRDAPPRGVRRARARHAVVPRGARGDRRGGRVGRRDDERAQLAAHADAAAPRQRRAEGALPEADGARRAAGRVRAVGARLGLRRRVAAHAGGARRRPLGAQRHQGVGDQRQHRRRDPRHGAHRRRRRAPRLQGDLRLHRDARPPRLRRGEEGGQDGAARLPHGAALVQRPAGAGREPGGRGRAGAHLRARLARPRPARHRRAVRRHRARRARRGGALRRRAPPVRQGDPRLPGHSVQAGRHGDAHRRLARAALRHRGRQGPRRARHAVQLHGQAHGQRDRDVRRRRGRADPRRLRLHQGLPRGALPARRQGHRDLRGHLGDPAGGDRAGAVRGL
ncbi:MAG: Acyl-CoA dehydrogenase, short-chain specific, partial [uncultured Gemmatimonadaceae bacterium]